MLEKPDLSDDRITSCLQHDYALRVSYIDFLPLGVDVNTAVYRAVAGDGVQYFVKLRRGPFDETSVTVPRFLSTLGIPQVITPIRTCSRQLWARFDAYTVVLYPYRPGLDGYVIPLSDHQWAQLGAALRGIHTAVLPETLARRIPRETYPGCWRDHVRMYQARIAAGMDYSDSVAAQAAAFLHQARDMVSHVVERAERLGNALRTRPLEHVLCHGDMHPGNVLIAGDDSLYVVDWDTLIYAPKERDLQFFGGDSQSAWRSAREESLFYWGYGRTDIDRVALAYYRFERIVEDVAAYCEQLFLTSEGGEDRQQGLEYMMSNFLPGHDFEVAYRSDVDPGAT